MTSLAKAHANARGAATANLFEARPGTRARRITAGVPTTGAAADIACAMMGGCRVTPPEGRTACARPTTILKKPQNYDTARYKDRL